MKRIILGATALSMAAFGSVAAAQTWNVGVGGAVNSGIGYVDADGFDNGVEILNDIDLNVTATMTADNGLTFRAVVDYDVNENANPFEVFHAQVGGSFGFVRIGTAYGVNAHHALIGRPSAGSTRFVGAHRNLGLLAEGRAKSSVNPGLIVDTRGARESGGTSVGVGYFTPSIAGFQAGVSYSTRAAGNRQVSARNVDSGNAFHLGAQYNGNFDGISLILAGGYSDFDTDFSDEFRRGYAVRGEVGYLGFSVSGVYGVFDTRSGPNDAAFGVGAGYRTGPWTFGLAYGRNTAGGVATDRQRIRGSQGFSAGADYALAPGVVVGAGIEHYTRRADAGPGQAFGGDNATAGALYLGLSF